MKTTLALLLVVATIVAGQQQDIISRVKQITYECAVANNVSGDQVIAIQQTADKSRIAATDDVKCFTKCAVGKLGYIVPGSGIDLERVVRFATAQGQIEANVRARYEVCRSLYTGANSCDESWSIYACFFSV